MENRSDPENRSVLQAVDRLQLASQVVHQGEMTEGGFGHQLAQFVRPVSLPQLMDPLVKPMLERQEFPLRKHLLKVADFILGGIEKLAGVQVSQGKGRKIPDQPRTPMHILQHAIRIGFRPNAQQLLIRCIPGIAYIGHPQATVDQLLFDFEANDDMQIIGRFVRLDTNQRRRDMVVRFAIPAHKCHDPLREAFQRMRD